jgi:hypothetical protein
MSARNRYRRPIVAYGNRPDNLEFSLKDKLITAANTLTDKANDALKKKLNPNAPVSPTDPALLPYNAAIKNAVAVNQGTPTPVSFFSLSNPVFVGGLVVLVLVGGYMWYKNSR